MDANRQAQSLQREAADSALREPARRESDPLTPLLNEIAADAREIAARYPQETRVPEGGE